MKVLVAGGTGFIGSALTRHLRLRGHQIALLSRRPAAPGAEVPVFHWDPDRGAFDASALSGVEAVVNLAGENLAAGRWNAERKRRLVESRVTATRFLVRRMREGDSTPRVLVNASAIGIYGNRGEEVLTEGSAPGSGFLSELCRAWELSALSAREAEVRVAIFRFGIVLGEGGGVLAKMVPVFRLGIGGPLGTGKQWMSWVALLDLVSAIELALGREDVSGASNLVAPAPVRNRDFARALGRALHRPAVLPAPAPALRIVLGEMAEEALSSVRVEPKKLVALGYRFLMPDLDGALRAALRR